MFGGIYGLVMDRMHTERAKGARLMKQSKKGLLGGQEITDEEK